MASIEMRSITRTRPERGLAELSVLKKHQLGEEVGTVRSVVWVGESYGDVRKPARSHGPAMRSKGWMPVFIGQPVGGMRAAIRGVDVGQK